MLLDKIRVVIAKLLFFSGSWAQIGPLQIRIIQTLFGASLYSSDQNPSFGGTLKLGYSLLDFLCLDCPFLTLPGGKSGDSSPTQNSVRYYDKIIMQNSSRNVGNLLWVE